jgi:serine/threonine-protein kinase
VRSGYLVNGRYRVEDMAGSGGMSVVVRATDVTTQRPVALKLGHPQRGQRAGDIARLEREARALAQLASPHVARLYEVSSFVDGGVTVPFLVLEYVDGVDLATWLRAKGPMSPEVAAAVVVQACDALGEAHARARVHRDVKPANLMLTASPDGRLCVKVVDFGIVRTDEREGRLTSTGDVIGSPIYMAPEQMRPDATVDARVDVWSLGVVLHEALTGRLPFEARSMPELCLAVMLDEPAPLPADCPQPIAAVVTRCLHKQPELRYASAADVAAALRAVAAPSVALSETDLELAALDAGAPACASSSIPPVRRRRGRAVAGLAAACVAATLALHTSPAPARSATIDVPSYEPAPELDITATAAIAPPAHARPAHQIAVRASRPAIPTAAVEAAPAAAPPPPPSPQRPAPPRDPLASPF